MKMNEPQQFRITAQLLLSILAGELYGSHDYSLWEIVRNAVCACMPRDNRWVEGVGDVEIFLREHPLAPSKKALIILDHGRGFTPGGFERFFTLGASMADVLNNPTGMHGGASQKRIGRFAALALNERCFKDKDGSTGFVVLTRRDARGEVCKIPVIPTDVEKSQRIAPQMIPADSSSMGFLAGIKGSFTAIVIAHPVFGSYAEIRDALLWRVPRRKDQMFKLAVGGDLLKPPALASEHCSTSSDGTIELFIERAGTDRGGIWFTDSGTGLRVACGRDMGAVATHVPYPFYSPDLAGDIFVPGILAKQGTSRTGLSPAFMRSSEWQRVTRYLATQAEPVRGLLGEGEPKPSSPARAAMQGLAEICNRAFGPPDALPDGVIEVESDPTGTKRRTSPGTDVVRPPITRNIVPDDGQSKAGRVKRVDQCIRVGDKTYRVVPNQSDPRTLVRVEAGVIYLNDAYEVMPTTRDRREEHVWQAVLMGVAHSETPDAPLVDILHRVSDWRKVLFKKAGS
jgi:hypothetical protein